jgi:cyclophilin family peptidyl-prolyl cis-trans isomerase
MYLRKFKKYLTVIFLSITLFALGCAGQTGSTTTSSTTSKTTASTTIAASSTSKTTLSPTTVNATPTTSSKPYMQWAKPPEMQIDTSKQYIATIKTEKGDLVLDLFAKDVPTTVNNFVFLSRQGFYNGTTFHRVIKNPAVAQGGDPTGKGIGTPGYGFANEITQHKHVTGAISMAHSAAPNSNGCQFFICYSNLPSLDGGYSVFGQLRPECMDILNKLTPRDPGTNPTFPGTKIFTITIEEK